MCHSTSQTLEFQMSGWTTRTMKRVVKTTKTTRASRLGMTFNPFCAESVCDDPTALPNEVVLSLAQAKLRCKHTNHQVEVQSMALKLYRKRMAKRHPAEARIVLFILGFQGESRRQEFLGNKSSPSLYTNLFSIPPRTDEYQSAHDNRRKNAPTIR